MLMCYVTVADKESPWAGRQGVVVCVHTGGSWGHPLEWSGMAKVRIGNSLTEWIRLDQLQVIETRPQQVASGE